MIFQAGAHRYNIQKSRKVTYETFTKRMALGKLEDNLVRAKRDLEQTPGNQRSRQREKIWRIEQRIDKLRLEIQSAD